MTDMTTREGASSARRRRAPRTAPSRPYDGGHGAGDSPPPQFSKTEGNGGGAEGGGVACESQRHKWPERNSSWCVRNAHPLDVSAQPPQVAAAFVADGVPLLNLGGGPSQLLRWWPEGRERRRRRRRRRWSSRGWNSAHCLRCLWRPFAPAIEQDHGPPPAHGGGLVLFVQEEDEEEEEQKASERSPLPSWSVSGCRLRSTRHLDFSGTASSPLSALEPLVCAATCSVLLSCPGIRSGIPWILLGDGFMSGSRVLFVWFDSGHISCVGPGGLRTDSFFFHVMRDVGS